MTSTTKSIVFSNKNQIESDHVKIEALSDKKELKKLVMKRQESRQQLNQSLHATPTQITNVDMPTYIPGTMPTYIPGATPAYIPGVMPTYIPGATPLPSRPIKVHRFQEKMCPMSDQNLNCQKFPKIQRLWTSLPFRM